MTSSRLKAAGLLLLLLLAFAAPASARAAPADPAIRALISSWYEALAKKEEGRVWALTAPGFIDASPHHRYAKTRSRRAGPRLYTSLAAEALRFAWEIDSVRADSSFAKVQVWERGYFYASAAQQTYERAAATTFVLERGKEDGRWRILAHQSSFQGIPPNKITKPMPDLRALYYATEGKNRDPAADARAVPKF
ncbi:MAG TPA: hypothetical protein VGB04_13235 [Allosphingosinicella sp.]|jgi:hypothetical protein